MRSLIEVTTEALNGLADDVQEWEEIEFLVDSGASATVVGKEEVRAVKASEPDTSVHYRLADGSRRENPARRLAADLTFARARPSKAVYQR